MFWPERSPTVDSVSMSPHGNRGNFVHSDSAHYRNIFAKTRMCKFYINGTCKHGSTCRYAHSDYELRPAPNFSKTKMCNSAKFSASGVCDRESFECRYAHNRDELVHNSVDEEQVCETVIDTEGDTSHDSIDFDLLANSLLSELSTNPPSSWSPAVELRTDTRRLSEVSGKCQKGQLSHPVFCFDAETEAGDVSVPSTPVREGAISEDKRTLFLMDLL